MDLASLFIEDIKTVDDKKVYSVFIKSGKVCVGDTYRADKQIFVVSSIKIDGIQLPIAIGKCEIEIELEGSENELKVDQSADLVKRGPSPGVTFIHNAEVNHFK